MDEFQNHIVFFLSLNVSSVLILDTLNFFPLQMLNLCNTMSTPPFIEHASVISKKILSSVKQNLQYSYIIQLLKKCLTADIPFPLA